MYTQASPSVLSQSAIGLGCLTTCPENGLMEGETEGAAEGKEWMETDQWRKWMSEGDPEVEAEKEERECNRVYIKMERGEWVKRERWMKGNWRGEMGMDEIGGRGLDNYSSEIIVTKSLRLSKLFLKELSNNNEETWIIMEHVQYD